MATTCLNADGPGGKDAYSLVQAALGERAIEAPDDFHVPPVLHLLEEICGDVGPCFVFRLHQAIDRDPVNRERTDRQRCEIKIYDHSPAELIGYEGTSFVYRFRFRVGSEVVLTRRFLHVFQLKAAKSPDDQHPVLSITLEKVRGQDRLQLRHSASTEDDVLAEIGWVDVADHWIDAEVQVTYSDTGALAIVLDRSDGRRLVQVRRAGDIDLWRGGGFVRPKWGFYRSLADARLPGAAEDSVRFANIAITRGLVPDSTCR